MIRRFIQSSGAIWVICFGLIPIIIASRWSTLSQMLVEKHDFRQTQTAYQTLTLARGEGSLLRPVLPIFGSPWTVPFEFPSFQYVASVLLRIFNLEIDFANRFTSLLFFVACLFPLYFIARQLMSQVAAFCTIVIFAFSPLSIQWSRASLIEYCALFFGLSFVLSLNKIWRTSSVTQICIASSCGALCGATKGTTLVPMILMAPILLPGIINTTIHLKKNLKLLTSVAIPIAISGVFTQLWTIWADHIKESNPATQWLTSQKLQQWNFGTINQRLIFNNWSGIIDRINDLSSVSWSLIVIALVVLFDVRSRKIISCLLTSGFGTVAIFFNLYLVHDYYLTAISFLFVLATGVALDGLSRLISIHLLRSISILAATTVLLVFSLTTQHEYWKIAYVKHGRPGSELRALSTRDQLAFVSYGSWNPQLLYYAQRRGMMLDPRAASLDYLQSLPDIKKYDFYAGDIQRPDVMKIRGWYLPIGSQTTRIDDELDAFKKWGLAIGSIPVAANFVPTTKKSLTCNGTDTFDLRKIPVGSLVRTVSDQDQFLNLSPSFQAVPVGTQIQIIGDIDKTLSTEITCQDKGEVLFEW